jgi:hypothetical protein
MLRGMKAALRRGMSLLGMHGVIARYPKCKEHALMHWLRWRRVLWPWLIRAHRRHRGGPYDAYLTSRPRWDGPGSQILATLSNICFAQHTGLTYVHTPFRRMSHAPTGMTDVECAARWEAWLRLGEHHPPVESVQAGRIINAYGPASVRYERGTLNVLDNCHAFTDRYPEQWLPVLERIKRSRRAPSNRPTNSPLIIAAHARRGDVPPNETLRYTSNSWLNHALSTVHRVLREHHIAYETHLYSEGQAEDFTALQHLEPQLHLNGDQIHDWEALRLADILLVSRSAYSYSAALLSDGIILCPRFWHEPLPGWVRVGRDGSVRTAELHKAVEQMRKRST